MGKPEPDVYRHALERLGCDACDAWMVGDNYEWEVEAPQKLGLCGIWYDPFDAGIPAACHGQTDARDQAAGRTAGVSALKPSPGPSAGLSVGCSIRRSTRPPSTRCFCSTSSMSSRVGTLYQTPSG